MTSRSGHSGHSGPPPPPGRGRELTRDGLPWRRPVTIGGVHGFVYRDTGKFEPDPAARPKNSQTLPSDTQSIPRSQTSQPHPAPQTSSILYNNNSRSRADQAGQSRTNPASRREFAPGLETEPSHRNFDLEGNRTRSRSRTRPDNPRVPDPQLPVRPKAASDRERYLGELQTSGEVSHSQQSPPNHALSFVAIGAGEFARCRDFVAKHPELVTEAESEVYTLALQAQQAGDNAKFRRCLERYVLIKECNKRSMRDQDAFLNLLAAGDVGASKGFYSACGKEASQLRPLPSASGAPPKGGETYRRAAEYVDNDPYHPRKAFAGPTPPSSYPGSHPHGQGATHQGTQSAPMFAPQYPSFTHRETGKQDASYLPETPSGQTEGAAFTSRMPQTRGPQHRRESFGAAPTHRKPPATDSFTFETSRTTYNIGSTNQGRQGGKKYHHDPLQSQYPSNAAGIPPIYQPPQQNQGPERYSEKYEAEDLLPPITRTASTPQHNTGPRKRSSSSKDEYKSATAQLETVDGDDVDYKAEEQTQAFRSQQRTLDPGYKVHRSKFFTVGRVFLIPWPENYGESPKSTNKRHSVDRVPLTGPYGEHIFSHPVRMIVVQDKKGSGYSHCIRINSYGGQGTKFKTLSERERTAHAVVYALGSAKPPNGTDGLTKDPIAVAMEPGQTLEDSSRTHFGKIYTVEHNVRVRPVGKVADESMVFFKDYFKKENFPLTSRHQGL